MNVLYLQKPTFEPLFKECGLDSNENCISDLYYIDPVKMFFYAFAIFLASVGVTGLMVSFFVKSTGELSKDEEEDEDEESEDEDNEKNYPYKYSDLFEELNDAPHEPLTVEQKKELKNKILHETTPKGNVVMYYHYNQKEVDASSFHYYCDDRSIQFNFLDTVARKYVTTYQCPELYLYLKTEIKKGVDQIKAEIEERLKEENEQVKKEASVFASFKNYKKPDAPEKKIRRLLVGKNRYTRLGNIEDWNITQRPKAESNVKNISFAEYKKRLQSA
jgi:hypothetical protein